MRAQNGTNRMSERDAVAAKCAFQQLVANEEFSCGFWQRFRHPGEGESGDRLYVQFDKVWKRLLGQQDKTASGNYHDGFRYSLRDILSTALLIQQVEGRTP